MNLEEIQVLKTMYLKTLTPLEEYNKEVSEVKMKVGSYAELIRAYRSHYKCKPKCYGRHV
ncbi:hypothetical protein [Tenacibaculum maritimum]|uniref:hypothetical protein n=1 Tax=Tenacibaculum maritimum TaxID=107401 RepID=UPI0038902C7E